jgi:class 3 adenylate cyclase
MAERRRERTVVTVLFADLVGFTSRAEVPERAVRAALAIRDRIVEGVAAGAIPRAS